VLLVEDPKELIQRTLSAVPSLLPISGFDGNRAEAYVTRGVFLAKVVPGTLGATASIGHSDELAHGYGGGKLNNV
jgi:hypothetical protein